MNERDIRLTNKALKELHDFFESIPLPNYREEQVMICLRDLAITRAQSNTTDAAIQDVLKNANEHAHKKPKMTTLFEEVAEATLAWRGKHEHPLRLELVQIAGICINMIRQLDTGELKEFQAGYEPGDPDEHH